MKPVKTLYNGQRFHSRLAAKWAVYFDALEIQYEYAPQVSPRSSGVSYQPDFFLGDLKLYVAVRVSRMPLADLRSIVGFAVDEDNPLILIVGNPVQEDMFLLDRVHCGAVGDLEYAIEGEASEDEIVEITLDSFKDFASVKFCPTPRERGWQIVYRTIPPPDELRLEEALLKARSTFDFDESG